MNISYKSKAVRLAEEVLKDIWQKVYPVEEYLPSEDELADKYGSSRMTMRKVLSILERDQVLIKIPNCGSKINPALKLPEPLATAPDPLVIGAVMAAFPDAMTIEVNRGIQDFAQKNRMSFLLIQNPEGPEALAADICRMGVGRFAGLIWLGPTRFCRNEIRELVSRRFPLVFVDNPLEDLTLPHIGVDNFGGMYTASAKLLEHFRTGIYYFGAQPELITQKQRYDGYCRAMCDFGLRDRIKDCSMFYRAPEITGHWFEADHNRAAALAAAKLLAQGEPFGVVAENDYIAQSILDMAKEMHRHAGKDFFICGFDDLPLAQSLDLSSVRQPRYELGFEAARLLTELIEGRETAIVRKLLPVKLIERGSTIIHKDV